MNCAVCGKDNQPGTRFCVHCGAALGPPRSTTSTHPTAAVPIATSTVTVTRPAATAGAGDALDTSVRTGPSAPAAANAPPIAPPPAPGAGVPAYAAQPSTGGGKIVLAIGIAALVVAAAGVGYKIFGGSAEVKDSLAGFGAPSPSREPSRAVEPAAVSPAPAPSREPLKVEEPPPAAKAEPVAPIPPPAVKADVEKPRATDAELKAKAPSSTTPKVDAKAAGKSGAPSAPGIAGAPSAPPSAPAAKSTPASPAAPAAPADAAPAFDRWTLMANDLRACRTENMFNRVVCDQRVRLRYCKDYWGTVPQCPGAVANPDKGQ